MRLDFQDIIWIHFFKLSKKNINKIKIENKQILLKKGEETNDISKVKLKLLKNSKHMVWITVILIHKIQ